MSVTRPRNHVWPEPEEVKALAGQYDSLSEPTTRQYFGIARDQRDEILSQMTQDKDDIRQSLGYSLLPGCRRRVRRLFPPVSRRGRSY